MSSANTGRGAGSRRTTGLVRQNAVVIETTLPGWLPDLDGTIVGGDLLRGWELSEVWRIRLDGAARKSVIAKRGLVTIDWSDAYVHPHLGDLYLLVREGRKQGRIESVRMDAMPELFAREAGTDPQTVIDQLVTGGLCWTMSALRWVVETGVHAVPVSREWIDELVTDL
jgi:hypothetical protein